MRKTSVEYGLLDDDGGYLCPLTELEFRLVVQNLQPACVVEIYQNIAPQAEATQ